MEAFGSEYGNLFDFMGSASYAIGMNPYYRNVLGWLDDSRIEQVNGPRSGVALRPINSTTGPVAARIDVTGGALWVHHRVTGSFDDSLLIPELAANLDGAWVEFVPDTTFDLATSYLLDVSGTVTDLTYTLQPGESYTVYGTTISGVQIANGRLTFDAS